MKKQLFTKLASRSKSLTETEEIREQALRDFYHRNPRSKKEDFIKTLAEFGIPMAALAGASKLKKMPASHGAIAGALPGFVVHQLADMGRSQKYLKEQGIDSNFLGTKLSPSSEKAKKRYFK